LQATGPEESHAAWQQLQAARVTRLLLVTDEVQSRRTTLAWRKLTGGQAEVFSTPCSAGCDSVGGWWRSRTGLKRVWLELARIAMSAAAGWLW